MTYSRAVQLVACRPHAEVNKPTNLQHKGLIWSHWDPIQPPLPPFFWLQQPPGPPSSSSPALLPASSPGGRVAQCNEAHGASGACVKGAEGEDRAPMPTVQGEDSHITLGPESLGLTLVQSPLAKPTQHAAP